MPPSKKSKQPRVPLPFRDIQVNFCKNTECSHFGAEASPEKQKGGTPTKDGYIIGSKRGQRDRIKCKTCGQYSTLKSNEGIYSECSRLYSYLNPDDRTGACPTRGCPNYGIDVSAGSSHYYKNKPTPAGSLRYKCRDCDRNFSIATRPTLRQRVSHKNKAIFVSILNKVPFKRICETEDIAMQTIYRKIDFFHNQCQAFVGQRERQLIDKLCLERVYIASDRQEFIVNWAHTTDKRNIILKAIASAEMRSGYIFGMHTNFDPFLDHHEVRKSAEEIEDHLKDPAFRRFARVWMEVDRQGTPRARKLENDPVPLGALESSIEQRYLETLKRPEIEASDDPDISARLPYRGLQIREEYTLYGHFFFLQKLLKNAGKVRFFLDQDTGIRAACLSAFKDEVRTAKCDAFYVSINKDLTNNEKLGRCAEGKRKMEEIKDMYPHLTDREIRILGITEEMKRMKTIGRWSDRWLKYPFPDKSEPEKAVCYLTNRNDYDETHMANLYHMASLKAIDSYFNQIRTRISCLQHSKYSSSNTGRRWYGYQPYNPALVQKLLDMMRVYYNYSLKSKIDKKTPAMRLGLARGPISVEDILNFKK